MAEDIRLATAAELDVLIAEVEKKANSVDILSEGYLKRQVIGTLPNVPRIFDFEDGKAQFSVPVIGGTVKGISAVDEESGNKYQRICSTGAAGASSTIGASSIVYSELDLSDELRGLTRFNMSFDVLFVNNGRMRVSIGELSTLRQKNGDTKYEPDGIAFDLFSSTSNTFYINGSGGVHESFFGKWLHCDIEFNAKDRTLSCSVAAKDDPTDIIQAETSYRSECDVTGIVLYTWLADDTVCFDNIKITNLCDAEENMIYYVKNGNDLSEYIYVDGAPISVGGNAIGSLLQRVAALENKESEVM